MIALPLCVAPEVAEALAEGRAVVALETTAIAHGLPHPRNLALAKRQIEEIRAAGGVERWEPGPYDPNEDWERMLWDWLKQFTRAGAGPPPLYLGIARDDIYLTDHRLLAEALPPGRTLTVDGKHRFSSFTKAWNVFLDRGLLK